MPAVGTPGSRLPDRRCTSRGRRFWRGRQARIRIWTLRFDPHGCRCISSILLSVLPASTIPSSSKMNICDPTVTMKSDDRHHGMGERDSRTFASDDLLPSGGLILLQLQVPIHGRIITAAITKKSFIASQLTVSLCTPDVELGDELAVCT